MVRSTLNCGVQVCNGYLFTAAQQVMRVLEKYRPETRSEKRARLRERAQARAEGKEDEPTKRPPVVHQGVNTVTKLVEAKKAQLVVIAHDVNPIEVQMSLASHTKR